MSNVIYLFKFSRRSPRVNKRLIEHRIQTLRLNPNAPYTRPKYEMRGCK